MEAGKELPVDPASRLSKWIAGTPINILLPSIIPIPDSATPPNGTALFWKIVEELNGPNLDEELDSEETAILEGILRPGTSLKEEVDSTPRKKRPLSKVSKSRTKRARKGSSQKLPSARASTPKPTSSPSHNIPRRVPVHRNNGCLSKPVELSRTMKIKRPLLKSPSPKRKKYAVPKAAALQGWETEKLFADAETYLKKFNQTFGGVDPLSIPLNKSDVNVRTARNLHWKGLANLITSLSSRKLLHLMDVEELGELLTHTTRTAQAAESIHLITPKKLPLLADRTAVQKAVVASVIAMTIMSAHGTHRTLIQGPVLKACLRCMVFHTRTNLIPIKDPTKRPSVTHWKGSAKNKNKRRRAKDTYWEVLEEKTASIMAGMSQIWDKLQVFLKHEPIDIASLQPVLELCFETLQCPGWKHVQLSLFGVIAAIFVKHSSSREDIIHMAVDTMYKCPSGGVKDSNRNMQFPVQAENRKSINKLNALILTLIQAIPASCKEIDPTVSLSSTPIVTQREVYNQTIASSLADVQFITQKFCKIFLNKFIGKKLHGRNVVMDFMEDCLALWCLPEWPAAEFVLKDLCFLLIQFLALEKKGKKKEITQARVMCLQLIGKVATCLKKTKREVEMNRLELGPGETALNGKANEVQELACPCGKSKEEASPEMKRLLIDCDVCHRWYHGVCVGISNREAIPKAYKDYWCCDACRIRRDLEHAIKRLGIATDDLDQDQLLKQLSLNYVTQRLYDEEGSVYNIPAVARQYQIMEWLGVEAAARLENVGEKDSDSESEGERLAHTKSQVPDALVKQFLSLWNVPTRDRVEKAGTFSRNGIIRINKQLAVKMPLLRCCSQLVKVVVHALKDTQPSFRSRGMKALSKIVEADPSTLHETAVKKTVQDRFRDKAASVREEAIHLIGNYILDRPQVVLAYYGVLVERIKDASLSVRKRVVTIFRDICIQDSKHPKYTEICCHLVGRVTEPNEQIRRLVTKTFEEMWFGMSNVIDKRMNRHSDFSKAFEQRIQQIVEVVASVADNAGAMEALIRLVSEMLTVEEKKSKKAQLLENQKSTRQFKICHDICSCIVIQMGRIQISEGAETEQKQKLIIARHKYLVALNLFCTVRPKFLVAHHAVLQTYLGTITEGTNNTKGNSESLRLLLSMMHMILPRVENPLPRFRKALLHDLTKILDREKNLKLLDEAVPCICILSEKINRDTSVLARLTLTMFRILLKVLKGGVNPRTNKPFLEVVIIRYIYVIGLLIKYFDFDANLPSILSKMGWPDRSFVPVMLRVYDHFFRRDSEKCQIFAVKGMLCIFQRDPKEMINQTYIDILRTCLGGIDPSKSSVIMKLQTMDALRKFLEGEDKRNLYLQSLNAMSVKDSHDDHHSNHMRKNETGIHQGVANIREGDETDCGVVSGVIQTLLEDIKSLCRAVEGNVRESACRLIQEIIIQGMINPIEALAELIALSCDPEPLTGDIAIKNVRSLADRHAVFFKSTFVDGLLLAFKSQSLIKGDNFDPLRIEDVTKRTSRLYQILKQTDRYRQSRHIIVAEILRVCNFEIAIKKLDSPDGQGVAAWVCFATGIIASFPFDQDEPLFLVHHLDTSLQSLGGMIDADVKLAYDKLQKAKTNPDKNHNSQDPLPVDLLTVYRAQLQRGLATAARVHLRHYLVESYGLTDRAIAEFRPKMSKTLCHRKKHDPINMTSIPLHRNVRAKLDVPHHRIPGHWIEQHNYFRKTLSDLDRMTTTSSCKPFASTSPKRPPTPTKALAPTELNHAKTNSTPERKAKFVGRRNAPRNLRKRRVVVVEVSSSEEESSEESSSEDSSSESES